MTKTSELYQSLLKRQAEQLRNIARDLHDTNLRDQFERLALDIAAEPKGRTAKAT
jgi:hypothetical protein